MSKISNILLMLQYLQNGRKYSIKELSERLEISPRMIRQYKSELEYAGIYIDTIHGPYGGYVLNKDINIPYLNINQNDIDILNSICDTLKDKDQKEIISCRSIKPALVFFHEGGGQEFSIITNDEPNSKEYNNLLDIRKIPVMIQNQSYLEAKSDKKEGITSLKNKLLINLNNQKSNKIVIKAKDEELNIFNKINNAYKNNLKIKIKYYNLKHGESIRTIYPLGMYLFQNEWWVSAYWEEKDDMRQFHLKRIRECQILDIIFNPQDINLKF